MSVLKSGFEERIELVKHQLANQIRQSREDMGVSQVELARRMGVSQPLISRIEKGENLPRDETLVRIAQALRLPEDHFLDVPKWHSSDNGGEVIEKLNLLGDAVQKVQEMVEEIPNKITPPLPAAPVSMPGPPKDQVELKLLSIDGKGELLRLGTIQLPRSIAGEANHLITMGSLSLEPFVLEGEMLLLQWCKIPPAQGRLCLVKVEGEGHSLAFVYPDDNRTGLGRSRYDARWLEPDSVKTIGVVTGRFSPLPVMQKLENWAMEH